MPAGRWASASSTITPEPDQLSPTAPAVKTNVTAAEPDASGGEAWRARSRSPGCAKRGDAVRGSRTTPHDREILSWHIRYRFEFDNANELATSNII